MRRSVYFEAPGRVAVREEAVPKPGAGEVLVETVVSAISSGTELLVYRGEVPEGLAADASLPALAGGIEFPLKYGYSAVGRVVETGDAVESSWMNRLVFAFQPHESHFTAPVDQLEPVPEGVPAESAAFLPNMETAVSLVMDGRPMIGETVAVLGQGIVGLLTASLLARVPLSRLVTLDRYPKRRAASLEMGAHASLDPAAANIDSVLTETLGDGADLSYELSGRPEALDSALAATGRFGRVVIGSWYGTRRAELDLGGRFHRSRISLASSQVSTIDPRWSGRWTKRRRLDLAWEMLERVEPARLVSHRMALTEAPEAFDLIDRNPQEVIQILLESRGASGGT